MPSPASRSIFCRWCSCDAVGDPDWQGIAGPCTPRARLPREPAPCGLPINQRSTAMGMNATQLIKMANQIGAFFASQPDPLQARAEYAQHLRRQWDPQMRTALYAHLDTSGGEGLS